jgi:hypothetical protein
MTHRRPRAAALCALAVLAASTLLGGSARAQTDDAPTLGGYQGRAASSGLHVFYNPDGLLPTAAILDVGSPDALATISSGPVTFARASVADPGDMLVNPDALLTQADPSWPSGTFPEYPFRIEANSTVGEPNAESRPAPGLDAEVEATSSGSTARSSVARSAAPGVASFGSMRSRATTTFDGSTLQVHARTEVSGFDLLGVLEIDSIVTDVVATSSGGDVSVSGGTVVTGATFMDQPVIIDEEGMRADPEAGSPDAPLLGAIREAVPQDLTGALADAGIRVSLPGPIEQDGQTAGTVGSTGLRIDLEVSERTAPMLGQLLDLLPPMDSPIPGAPGPADLAVFIRATHLSALEVGRAQVSLTTTEGYVAPPFEMPGTGSGIDASATPAPAPPAPTLGLPSPRPQPAAPAPAIDGAPTAPVATSELPAPSLAAGIGALALLTLLAQPFFGDRLARAAAAVLATSPTDTCPLSEEP